MATARKRTSVKQPENYGYPIFLRRQQGQTLVCSGCRKFTFAQATKHWAKRAKEPRCVARVRGCTCGVEICERGKSMLKLLPILRARAKGYGWTEG